MKDLRIILNKIKTPDGTILTSHHVHDYVTHTDANGEMYMVDGGKSYLKRSVNKIPYEELSLYNDQPHEIIRENFEWGSRGKKGNEPLFYIKLVDITNEHLLAIIETQKHIPEWVSKIFNDEKSYRKIGE